MKTIDLEYAEERFLLLIDKIESGLFEAADEGRADQVLTLTGKLKGALETWTAITGGDSSGHD